MFRDGGHRASTLSIALVSKQAAISILLGKQYLLEGKGRRRRGKDGGMGGRQAETEREGGRRGVHSEHSATRAAVTGQGRLGEGGAALPARHEEADTETKARMSRWKQGPGRRLLAAALSRGSVLMMIEVVVAEDLLLGRRGSGCAFRGLTQLGDPLYDRL